MKTYYFIQVTETPRALVENFYCFSTTESFNCAKRFDSLKEVRAYIEDHSSELSQFWNCRIVRCSYLPDVFPTFEIKTDRLDVISNC